MDRKGTPRGRHLHLRAISQKGGMERESRPVQEVVALALSYRMVFSDSAEVWTVRGITRDGTPTTEDIGELAFILIPGDQEPATSITGYIAPLMPFTLALTEDALWRNLRDMIVQLGYDLDGFFASVSLGGRPRFYEEVARNGR